MSINVLLVDDNKNCLELYNSVLENIWNITLASNGEDVLKEILTNYFDIVFLDIHMPKLSGYEIIEIINKHDTLKNIPIIIISAESEQEYVKKAYSLGVKDYIQKPIDLDDLISTIKYYIELSS